MPFHLPHHTQLERLLPSPASLCCRARRPAQVIYLQDQYVWCLLLPRLHFFHSIKYNFTSSDKGGAQSSCVPGVLHCLETLLPLLPWGSPSATWAAWLVEILSCAKARNHPRRLKTVLEKALCCVLSQWNEDVNDVLREPDVLFWACFKTLTWSRQRPSTLAVANCCSCHPQPRDDCTEKILLVRRSHSLWTCTNELQY